MTEMVIATRIGGAETVPRPYRGPQPSKTGECISPDCSDDVGNGGRFCPTHEAILDRVRLELFGDGNDSELAERNRKRALASATRGMGKTKRSGGGRKVSRGARRVG